MSSADYYNSGPGPQQQAYGSPPPMHAGYGGPPQGYPQAPQQVSFNFFFLFFYARNWDWLARTSEATTDPTSLHSLRTFVLQLA